MTGHYEKTNNAINMDNEIFFYRSIFPDKGKIDIMKIIVQNMKIINKANKICDINPFCHMNSDNILNEAGKMIEKEEEEMLLKDDETYKPSKKKYKDEKRIIRMGIQEFKYRIYMKTGVIIRNSKLKI